MILLMYSLMCCIDPPKELPPSRLQRASTGSMIQYGKLKGFLVQRGVPTKTLLWKVEKIDAQIKNCALQQIPSETRALLVDDHITLAQDYLQSSAPPSSFKCTQ